MWLSEVLPAEVVAHVQYMIPAEYECKTAHWNSSRFPAAAADCSKVT